MNILSVKEVANILGVSVGTVHRYIHKEGLPAYQLSGGGSKVIIYEQGFQEWLKGREPVISKGGSDENTEIEKQRTIVFTEVN